MYVSRDTYCSLYKINNVSHFINMYVVYNYTQFKYNRIMYILLNCSI